MSRPTEVYELRGRQSLDIEDNRLGFRQHQTAA
jgi:hypothetical protein